MLTLNTALKATGNTSELEKMHSSNQTWKWWKVCVDRQTV